MKVKVKSGSYDVLMSQVLRIETLVDSVGEYLKYKHLKYYFKYMTSNSGSCRMDSN